jgi:hypothetical protein
LPFSLYVFSAYDKPESRVIGVSPPQKRPLFRPVVEGENEYRLPARPVTEALKLHCENYPRGNVEPPTQDFIGERP